MRAAVVTAFDRPLELRQVPIPYPQPGQILVRIEASGLCHTDIHTARGDWPVKPTLPLVPGHEGIGIVEQLGVGVSAHGLGERVALPWLGYACGTCRYCMGGRETLCEAQRNTGYSMDGGHAEYAVADARFAIAVPEGLDPCEAAPLACAGLTTYTAVKAAGVQPGEQVAVFGIGGLGHLAVQYAKIFGGRPIAVDVTCEKLALATQLGADAVVDAATDDPAVEITRLGGADVAIAVAAQPQVLEQAHASLCPGGRLVLVALPRENTMRLPVFQTVRKGITVLGSVVGTRSNLAEVFALHAAGRTHVVHEIRKLDEINEAIEDILAGIVPARVVLQP